MDPFISGVLSGVVANGLWAALTRFAGAPEVPSDRVQPLAAVLQDAISSLPLAPDFDVGLDPTEVQSFLRSPELAAIIRQVYATQSVPRTRQPTFDAIRSELNAIASLHFHRPAESLTSPVTSLFEALLTACHRALQYHVEQGTLSAHEATSAFRTKLLTDELDGINKNLEFLVAARNAIDVPAIRDFERLYRTQIALRHGFIIPPHFHNARKVPIDQLFVSPHIEQITRGTTRPPSNLPFEAFLRSLNRAVLLGNPGVGKSTLASKICHDLALATSPLLADQPHATPIVVVLRQYGAARKDRSLSILQFIEETAHADCQAGPPKHFFEYLLLNGRGILIFDGLDELLDTTYRQQITSDVELFCNLYPSVPVFVTSRIVGYESAPLDPKIFETYRLKDFNEEQVAQYAHNWFATDEELPVSQRDKMADSFIRQSAIAPDLRSNPLMLALMCNIFRGENYIPRNRPAIYDKCATMLFERWDRSRGILVALPFEDHIDPAMKHLAFWIYSDETLQGGVTESALVAKATEYLYPRRFDDPQEAQAAARQFVEFCTGRAWVFTDTGTTSEGDRLYQFTHRTFLEYFAAAHLVRTNATTAELFKFLAPRIRNREWDVVAQLAVQLMNRRLEGAADQFLLLLLDRAAESGANQQRNLLSFAARCLEFLVPNPATSRKVALDSLNCLVHNPAARPFGPQFDLMAAILSCSLENTRAVEQALVPQIQADLLGTDDHRRAVAMEFALSAPLLSDTGAFRHDINPLPFELRDRAIGTILDANLHLKYLFPHWELVSQRRVPISSLVAHFGPQGLFTPIRATPLRLSRPSMALLLVSSVLGLPPWWDQGRSDSVLDLQIVGNLLSTLPPPWTQQRDSDSRLLGYGRVRHYRKTHTLSRDGAFGLFALLATLLESAKASHRNAFFESFKDSQEPCLRPLLPILLSRYRLNDPAEAARSIQSLWHDPQQAELALAWSRREVNFAARAKRRGAGPQPGVPSPPLII